MPGDRSGRALSRAISSRYHAAALAMRSWNGTTVRSPVDCRARSHPVEETDMLRELIGLDDVKRGVPEGNVAHASPSL